ncbi:hypothetical protein LZY01_10550 [Levilactobacillus zymae]|uniref:PduM family microcompartment protein n=1 Tax=Levilactobacillus zymae TaxID=267363 RepID=A0ABQ0WZJ3_9LACO|nr:PduM family microcompartment protein [Levilactobacillus zymae]KRL07422.1 hypothetical protein FD38_GL000337 [Levilactobacillus zymae DSM 19395]QFR60535.1 PduM family microcompartment protein [Levilactobacillus zymae]GEO71887.1 hypothetical protein LZY01_10550 [Levilactobacillus zymae]
MDDLIEKVIEKLRARQTADRVVALNEVPSPLDEQLFIDYGCLILTNVSVQLIKALYTLDQTNPQVAWILQGLRYDVQFYLQINERLVNFVPRTMVLDWPINFIVGRNSPVIGSYNPMISRNEIAALPDNAYLVKTAGQRLTDEGLEICERKNIKIQIRTEENCIWRK